jgi:hypothetical protein
MSDLLRNYEERSSYGNIAKTIYLRDHFAALQAAAILPQITQITQIATEGLINLLDYNMSQMQFKISFC